MKEMSGVQGSRWVGKEKCGKACTGPVGGDVDMHMGGTLSLFL